MFGEGAGDAGAATTGRLWALGPVGLLPLGWRQAGVVGGLGRGAEPGFELGDTRGQDNDLPGLRLDQGDQVNAGEGEKRCRVHTHL